MVPEEEVIHKHDRLPRSRDCFESTVFWASRLLLLVWFVVIFAAACTVMISWEEYCDQRHGQRLGEDPTGNVPELPRIIQDFQLSTDFTVNPLNTSKEEMQRVKGNWDDFMPVGQGFFNATKNTNQLPIATVDPENHPAHAMAVFHQLHCLYMVMQAYISGVRADEETEETASHLRHCFEYLRVSLACHGDTALGGRIDVIPQGMLEHDQQGAKHVCKDWGTVRGFAERHRTNEFRGIINADRDRLGD